MTTENQASERTQKKRRGMSLPEYKKRVRIAENNWEAAKVKERKAFEELEIARAFLKQAVEIRKNWRNANA